MTEDAAKPFLSNIARGRFVQVGQRAMRGDYGRRGLFALTVRRPERVVRLAW